MPRRKANPSVPVTPLDELLEAVNEGMSLVTPRRVPTAAGEFATLPPWMPPDIANECARAWEKLLKRNSPADVRKWLSAREVAMHPIEGFRSVPDYPQEHEDALEVIAYARQIEMRR